MYDIPDMPSLHQISPSSDPYVDRQIVMSGPVGWAWQAARYYDAAKVLELFGEDLRALARTWQRPYIDELFSYMNFVVNPSQDVTDILQLEVINYTPVRDR